MTLSEPTDLDKGENIAQESRRDKSTDGFHDDDHADIRDQQLTIQKQAQDSTNNEPSRETVTKVQQMDQHLVPHRENNSTQNPHQQQVTLEQQVEFMRDNSSRSHKVK